MLCINGLLLSLIFSCCVRTNAFKGHYTKHFTSGNDDFVISVVTNGSYSIIVNGTTWLNNAPTYFNANNKTYSSVDGSLKLGETSATSGVDKIGSWQSTNFAYQTNDPMATKFTATIKIYNQLPIIIFQQVYNDGANWAQGPTYEDLCGGFPGFKMEGNPGKIGFLSYGGFMFGDTNKHIGTWSNQTYNINDGITGGPLALFDRDGRTIVLTPFNNFMSASFLHDKNQGGNYYGGIMGGVSTIPSGYHQDFIMYYGQGINKAFEGWGKTMRSFYGKSIKEQEGDITIKYLGYWTDNGAYYYYNREVGKTYEQTVLDIRAYIDKMNIPYRYFQYDSWWYYKGKGGGVKTWVSRPDVFPDGFVNVTKMINFPAVAHNRYWASDTTYAKQNGGKYDFIVETSKAVPITKQFWMDLFSEGKKWGLVLYEQDWLNVEFSGLKAFLHDLDLGAKWLSQMAEAAQENGIYIQYCMANPRHAMQSLLYPAVTQGRVSNDYQPGGVQWNIGISSIFATAIGIAPFKDTFWTTESQPGNIYNRTEPNWKLNAAVSTLSTGPVGPSDMIGGTNAQILMKCCRADGVILKPQYPIRAVDAEIIQAAFGDTDGPGGEVWISYTDIGGLRFANLLVLNLPQGTQYTMYPRDTGIYDHVPIMNTGLYAIPYDDPDAWVGFNYIGGLSFTDRFNPARIGLYQISQAIPGMFMTVIIGEMDKWAPVSHQRIQDIKWTNDTVMAPLIGAPNESFDFWYILGSKANAVKCKLDIFGKALFEMNNKIGNATCK